MGSECKTMKAIEAPTFPFHLLSLLDGPKEPMGRGSTKSTTSTDHDGLKRPLPSNDDHGNDTRCNVQHQYLQYIKRRKSAMKQEPLIMPPNTHEQNYYGISTQNVKQEGFYANFSRRRHRRMVKRRKAMDHTKTFFSITHTLLG